MSRRSCFFLVSVVMLGVIGTVDLVALGQEAAPADPNSYRFSQPIPVTIRKSNNTIVQMMLVGISPDGISVVSPQGKSFEYANKTFRSVRSPDGSFFYSPTKDNPVETIARLNKLMPSNNGGQPGAAAGAGAPANPFSVVGAQPGQAHNQPMPTQPMPTQPMPTQPAAAHGQPSVFPPGFGTFGQNNAAAESARMAAHAQAAASNAQASNAAATSAAAAQERMMAQQQAAANQSASQLASAAHMQTPHTSPMPADSHASNRHTPDIRNSMPRMDMNPVNTPNMLPQQTLMYEYECSKCRHKVTSAVEIKAGHRCTNCGVVWGQVQDENGRITSSSPAARIGGGVGIVVTIIGIIVAIVRKANAA